MKRIILILVTLAFWVTSYSQSDDTTKYVKYPGLYGLQYQRLWGTKVLRPPVDTIWTKTGLATIGSTVYVGNGVKWTAAAAVGDLSLKADKATTITINGVTYDLSANRTWSVGTLVGADTTNKWVQDSYVRSDSLFKYKNGTETYLQRFYPYNTNPLGYLTGNQTITLSGDVSGSGTTAITTTIGTAVVSYAKIQDVAGLSVIGRASNSSGVSAAITAANDNEVLRRSGTSIGFGTLANASLTNSAITINGTSVSLGGTRTLGWEDVLTTGQTITTRSVPFSTNTLTFSGSASTTIPVLQVTNTGAGVGVKGTSNTGNGVEGTSTDGAGGVFTSTNLVGIQSTSLNYYSGIFGISPTTTNTAPIIIQYQRLVTSGFGANGVGMAFDYTAETSDGTLWSMAQQEYLWTDATPASRTSQINFKGMDAAVQKTFMNIQTGGIVRVNNLADTLATKAYARSVGGGGSGEANTASNLAGNGVGIWKDKSGVDLRFKRLKAGSGISITDNTDSVTIANTYTNLTSFVDQNNWKVFYSNGSGDVTELALGADGTFLKSNGAAAAPSFATPAGSGDMILASAQTNLGIKTFLDGTMKLRNVANTFDGYFVNTNTADRIYTLPDRALTIDNITTATTSNGTGFVKANGSVISFDNSTYTTTTDRRVAFQVAVGTDANITAAAGTAYSLPAATLTIARNIDMTNVNTNGDVVEIDNQEAGFTWTFTGQTVYDAYENAVTVLMTNTRYIIRRTNGKLKIIN